MSAVSSPRPHAAGRTHPAPVEPSFKTQAGVWIDHRKAVVVVITGKEHSIHTVVSNAERHVRFSGGSHDGASLPSPGGSGEDTRERRFEGELDVYYEEVAGRLRDAEAIWIIGPGEAKGELRKLLEYEGAGARILGVESADKLSDPQVAARIRELFAA